jgi:ankyrin repeat protein
MDLHHLCAEDRLDDVLKRLEHPDLYTKDKSGRTPLHVASLRGNAYIIKALLATITDESTLLAYLDEKDNQQHVAVYWACWSGNAQAVHELQGSAHLNDLDLLDALIAKVCSWQDAAKYSQVVEHLQAVREQLVANPKPPLALPAQELSFVLVEKPVEGDAEPPAAALIYQCLICDEHHSSAITCSSGTHHMCGECLDCYTRAEVDSAAGEQRIANNNGRLCCPGEACTSGFSYYQLAQHLPQPTFDSLHSVWQGYVEQAQAASTAAAQLQLQQQQLAQQQLEQQQQCLIAQHQLLDERAALQQQRAEQLESREHDLTAAAAVSAEVLGRAAAGAAAVLARATIRAAALLDRASAKSAQVQAKAAVKTKQEVLQAVQQQLQEQQLTGRVDTSPITVPRRERSWLYVGVGTALVLVLAAAVVLEQRLSVGACGGSSARAA